MDSYISVKPFIEFMMKAHEGQVDKVGQPYYLHPLAVSNNVESILNDNDYYKVLPDEDRDHLLNRAIIVAICHDLFEDTNTTEDDLIKLGADNYIITALRYLTYKKGVPYDEYIKNMINGIAMVVKLADLTHNMDIKRFSGVKSLDEQDLKRLNKYLKYYNILQKIFDDWLKDYNEFVS